MWKVQVEDLTHLGGPMGTEYTTTTETRIFSTKGRAISWIEKQILKMGKSPAKTLYKNRPSLMTWDCGYIGYSLTPIKVDQED